MDDSTLKTSTGSTVPTGWCPSVYRWEGTPWRCAIDYLEHHGDHIANVGPDEEITWTDALAEPTNQDRTPRGNSHASPTEQKEPQMTTKITTTDLSPAQYQRRITIHVVMHGVLLLTFAIGGPAVVGLLSRHPALIEPVGLGGIVIGIIYIAARFLWGAPTRTIQHIKIETLGPATRAPEKSDPDAV